MSAPLIAGVLSGGVVVGYLAWRKGKVLETRGTQLQVALASQGAHLESYMASRGSQLARELQAMARTETEARVRATATQYLSTEYGLTPERIASIQVLAERFS